jgi:hypothetical protein
MRNVFWVVVIAAAAAAAAMIPARAAEPAGAKPAAKDVKIAAGLLVEKKGDSITVQADGEEAPVKYQIGPLTERRTLDEMKSIFDVQRVRVRYAAADGDARQVVSVEKVPGRAKGIVIGEVVKVYNDFWVAVKPKDGMIEGFALNGPPDKVKAAADVLKSLKPGDTVAIRYATDFERHRILEIEKKAAPAAPVKPTK